MTTTPTAPRLQLQYKVRPPKWDENEHPRDRKGRFIETGAEVRIWGGQSGTVLRNVGGGKIEVQRADGKKVIVHRNYLTVTARPNGEAPTDQESEDVEVAPVEAASPDAEEDPALADGEDVALPDRGGAPDRLVDNVTPGEQVGDYTVGEYVDGPSNIDGWVVGVTESGGPIVRTEEGQDWPLLPDAQIARDENGPEMPEQGAPEAEAAPETAAPEQQTPEAPETPEEAAPEPEAPSPAPEQPAAPQSGDTDDAEVVDNATRTLMESPDAPAEEQVHDLVSRRVAEARSAGDDEVDVVVGEAGVRVYLSDGEVRPFHTEDLADGDLPPRPAPLTPERQRMLDAVVAAQDEEGMDPSQRRRLGGLAEAIRSGPLDDETTRLMLDSIASTEVPGARTIRERLADTGTQDAPEANAPETDAPEGDVLDSLNPSDSGVFEDYASGREFRANAPLADNMTTLAETEGVDPDEQVTVYRGVPEDAPEGLQPGDFVTTNRQLAEDYAGGGRIEEAQVRYGDVLDDRDEPGGEEYIYRPSGAIGEAPVEGEGGEGDLIPKGGRESHMEGERITAADVKPGDVLNTLSYGDLAVAEVNDVRGRSGRTAGGSSSTGSTSEIVGVDASGMIRRIPVLQSQARFRRISEGRDTTLPERTREKAKYDAIQPGDRIDTPGGEVVVVRVQPGVSDTGRGADLWYDDRTGSDKPLPLRVRDNQNIEVTGHGEEFDPKHEQVLAAADAAYAGNENDLYYRDLVNEVDTSTLPEEPAEAPEANAPEAPAPAPGDVDEDDAPASDVERREAVAFRAGYEAMLNDESRAPALNATVMDLIDPDAQPGDEDTMRIMQAFTRGYSKAIDDEIAGTVVLPEVPEEEDNDLPDEPGVIGASPSQGRTTKITLPNGEVATRSSKSRVYTHVVVSEPATPEARAAAFNRRADALEARADVLDAAVAENVARKKGRGIGGREDDDYFHSHEAWLVGTEVRADGRSRVTYPEIQTRTNHKGEVVIYGGADNPDRIPEGVEVIRTLDDGTPVVKARPYLLAQAREKAAGNREMAARLREEGAQPDPGGYNVLRWTSSPTLGRSAANGELSYEAEQYGRTIRVLPVDPDVDEVEVDPERENADQIARRAAEEAGLDSSRIKLQGNLYVSTAAALNVGDVVYTRDDSSLSPARGSLAPQDKRQRTIARFGYDPDARARTVEFTDGTSTVKPSGGTRVAHVPVADRTGGDQPEAGDFDPNTDPRLADMHERLARARDESAPKIERVGLYGTLADEVNGYRAGTRGDSSFTPEEAQRLVEWRTELQAERQAVLDAPDPEPEPEPSGPTEVDATPNGQYRVGQTVEVQTRDFSQPGHPQVWRRGTVERITLDENTGLSDVYVMGEDDQRLPTQRVGSRGGNPAIRAIDDQPDEGDEEVPEAGAPAMPSARAAADFINAAVVGEADPEMRDAIQAALNPTTRAVNGIYGADGMRMIERHPEAERLVPWVLTARAGITTRDRRRVWDGDRAQIALNRLLSGDETLPANSIGKRTAIEVLDMDAPIRLGQPATTKRVEGVVDSISEGTSPGLYLRIIDDNGEPHVQMMRPDATVEILPDREPDAPSGGDRPAPKEVEAPNGSIRYGRRPEDLQPGDRVHTSGGSLMEERFVQTEPTASAAPQGGGQVYPFGNQIRTVDRVEGDRVYFVTDENFIGGQQRYASINTFRLQRDAMGRTSPDKTVMIEHDADVTPQPSPDPAPQPSPDPEPEPAPTPSPEPRGPFTLGEGTAVEGDVIVNTRTGGAVQLTSVSRQSVGLTSFDGYTQANPLYGDGDLDRLLASYRPATDEEAATFRQRLAVARGEVDSASLPDVTTEDVRASDLAEGDRVVFEDGTIATIEGIEPADDLIELEYRDSNGLAGSYFADPGATIQRLAVDGDGDVPDPDPEPEEAPEAVVERTAQVLGGNLAEGDRVWLGTTGKAEVVSVEPHDADTVMVTFRTADRQTFTTPFGREAVLDRADDEFLPDSSPLPEDARTSRPVLYTYQRRNIVALGLDTDGDPMVAEAARRIRLRQPLAAEHSAALAQRLSEFAEGGNVKPQRARMFARLAGAMNAANIEAGGRGVDLPVMPDSDRVVKGRPGDMGVGDYVTFLGAGGALVRGKVVNARRMMSGRLTEVTLRGPDGYDQTMLLTRNTDVYVLPDLPEPTPVAPSGDAPELVEYGSLRVGDRIRIPNTHDLFDDERHLTEATVVEAGQSEGLAYAVLDVHSVMSNDPEQREVLTIDPRMQGIPPQVVRISRGEASADQPRETDLPAMNPQQVDASEIQVGDWIATSNRNVGTTDGIVVDMMPVLVDGERIGTKVQLRRPGANFGSTTWATIMDGEENRVTRLIANDQNTILRIEEEKRKRARASQEALAARSIEQALADYNGAMHFRVVQNALHGGTVADEHYGEAIHAAFIGGQDPTTSLDDDRMRAIRNLTRSLQGHLSGEHPDEPGFNGVRDAAWRLAEQIVNDHNNRVFRAMMAVQPTQPGETKTAAGIALARSVFNPDNWGPAAMEQRDLNALARGIVNAREAREAAGGDGAVDRPAPEVPAAGSLRDRIAAYKASMSSRFGFVDSSVTTYGDFDLDSLERGEVPELTTATARSRDKATDGGPGATTMAQLDTLKAAGADLAAAVDARILRDNPDLTPDAVTALEAQRTEANRRYEIAAGFRNEAYKAAQNEEARKRGYDSYAHLQNALNSTSTVVPEGKDRDTVFNDYREVSAATRTNEAFLTADAASNEAYQGYQSFAVKLRDMRARLAEARAKAARDTIAEVRDMGGTQLSYRTAGRRQMETTNNPLRSGETMKAMRYAETNYPTEWLDALNGSPKGALAIGTTKRGFFQSGAWIIRLSKDDNRNNEGGWVPPRGRVATHELGHAMETVIPGLSQAEEAFLWSRTSTGEVGERQRTKRKRIDSSTSYLDEFREAYSGKDYADGTHYELFTTGMESLFAGSEYLDDDYRNWMLGVLALL